MALIQNTLVMCDIYNALHQVTSKLISLITINNSRIIHVQNYTAHVYILFIREIKFNRDYFFF